jgi:hypothetical protein
MHRLRTLGLQLKEQNMAKRDLTGVQITVNDEPLMAAAEDMDAKMAALQVALAVQAAKTRFKQVMDRHLAGLWPKPTARGILLTSVDRAFLY